MIVGSFDHLTGRPYVSFILYFPRLRVRHEISFLLDTGADTSILMPTDARQLGIDYTTLVGHSESGGIGGSVYSYVEQALVIFEDTDNKLVYYKIELDIMHPGVGTDDIPSLLGRDILDRWSIVYNPSKHTLTAEVQSADAIRDISTQGA